MSDTGPNTSASNPFYEAMVAAEVDYRPWEGQGLDEDRCFLCTRLLEGATRTVEDVIPRWVQRQVIARGRSPAIQLPNLTELSPRRILVPSCVECNGIHLSRIERVVSTSFRSGPSHVAALPEHVLRGWLGKIAYGTRRNDLRLRSDVRDPRSATLATSDDLRQLAFLHMLLQEVRGVIRVAEGHSTFFVFDSQTAGCNVCDFDIALPIGWPNPVMLRLGDVSVMGAIDDRGALRTLLQSPAFAAARVLSLHPIQVRALWALMIEYCTMLRPERLPVRFRVSHHVVDVERTPGDASHLDPAMASASANAILAALLAEPQELVEAHGGAIGMLVAPNGLPRQMPLEHGVLKLGL